MPAGARGGGGVAEAFGSAEAVTRALAGESYLADRGLATSVYLAATLEQPLLLEGEAGVGKTEVARALAAATGARLIRLQCHEGIDLHHAVYDWDYGTITWARALLALGPDEPLEDTLGVALKVREDIERVRKAGVLRDA